MSDRALRSFPRHAFSKYLTLNDLVRGMAAHHLESSELAATVWTPEIAFRLVLQDPFGSTFDKAASTTLPVFVEQGPTCGAVNGYGANVFARHSVLKLAETTLQT